MAIAANARDSAFTSTSGSTSVSETFTVGGGSGRLLAFFTLAQSGNPSTLTWNTSESGTNDKTEYDPGGTPGTTNFVSVGHRLNPTSGAHTAAADKSDNTGNYFIACADYTGAKQSAQPDATASGTATATTSVSYTLTTVAAECWIVTSGWATGGSLTSGTNCTFFVNDGSRGAADSNASVGAAGGKTVSFSASTGRLFGASFSFSPSTTSTLTLTENLSNAIIELFSRVWTAPRAQSEVLVLQGESTSRTWNAPRSPSDVITITETITGIKGRIIEIMETLGINESLSRSWTLARSFSESVGITERFTRVATYVRGLVETQTIIEYLTSAVQIIRTLVLSEVVSIIDTVRTPLNWLKRTVPTTIWTKRTKP